MHLDRPLSNVLVHLQTHVSLQIVKVSLYSLVEDGVVFYGLIINILGRLTRSGSERSLNADETEVLDLTGVRRAPKADRTLTPAENLRAWELSHGILE